MFNVYTLAACYCNVENVVSGVISSAVCDACGIMTVRSLNHGCVNENVCRWVRTVELIYCISIFVAFDMI
jgi:hypothetical protein